MVYGFIIQGIDSPPTVYFACFFTAHGNDINKKKKQQAVVDEVEQELKFRQNCDANNATFTGLLQLDSKEAEQARLTSNQGEFRIPAGSFFDSQKFVIWRQLLSTVFVIICEPDENRLLASNFLSLLPRILIDNFKNPQLTIQPKEMLLKPEEVLILIQSYLPNGQLLFANGQFVRHLKRDAEAALQAK